MESRYTPLAMTAASPPPRKQDMEAPSRRIPPEILEEILLNLPVKSLVRFSCVSKSWKSTISESRFIRRHRRRGHATLLRKRVFIRNYPCYFHVKTAFSSSLSSISNHHTAAATSRFFCPFQADVTVKALCEELWCIQVRDTLYLWNPSMGTSYKKLRHPQPLRPCLRYLTTPDIVERRDAVYGIGYDPVDDDFKLLEVWRIPPYLEGTMLYSLQNNSWRRIDDRFPGDSIPHSNGEFVNRAFHWTVPKHDGRRDGRRATRSAIVSFDLSTESYRELPEPMYSRWPENVEVAVLRGMLCVFLNYTDTFAFVLWVMKEYGVKESWTKMYDVRYFRVPSMYEKIMARKLITFRPLYLYEDGQVLVWCNAGEKDSELLVYRDGGEVVAQHEVVDRGSEIAAGGCSSTVPGAFVYVESLVSPAAWPPVGDNNQGQATEM